MLLFPQSELSQYGSVTSFTSVMCQLGGVSVDKSVTVYKFSSGKYPLLQPCNLYMQASLHLAQ